MSLDKLRDDRIADVVRLTPMLAAPIKKGCITTWTEWAVEEKYDGHRLLVHVTRPSVDHQMVRAFARPRGDGRVLQRTLPDHLVRELAKLPPGVYDGELLGGADDATGTDATRKDLAHRRSFVVFDLLRLGEVDVTTSTYDVRRRTLQDIFSRRAYQPRAIDPAALKLAPSRNVAREADVTRFVAAVWKRGGEGAILKRRDAAYYPGQRAGSKRCPLAWVKLKRVSHAVLTLVGFEPSRGTVRFPGHPFAILKLRDVEGNVTTCKTPDDATLDAIEASWNEGFGDRLVGVANSVDHPWVGKRRVMIEFPKRTRTGGYQGPVVFDRWAEEGE